MEAWVIVTIVIAALWLAFEFLDRRQKKKAAERLKELSELENSNFEL